MTKDSMATLESCLASLAFCDEIVVVDDYSSDGTWEFLQTQGGKVRCFQRRLDTFVAHRRALCERAQGDWILLVDADECALDGLGEELRGLIAEGPQHDAYFLPLRNVLPRQWPRPVHFSTTQKRLFRRGGVWWEDSTWIHVPALHKGKAGNLRHGVEHRIYDSMPHMIRKQVAYGQSGARHLYGCGKKSAGALGVARHMAAAFAKFYLVKGLWRQGMGGLCVALAKAFYVYVKYAALWELEATGGVAIAERRQVPGGVVSC